MGVCRIALAGKIAGADEIRNVFTVSFGGANFPQNSAVAAWLSAMYVTSGLTFVLSSRVQFERFIVEQPIDGHWEYTYEYPLIFGGTESGDALPNQICAVVTGITASRRRAKKFIGGLCERSVTNGVIQSELSTPLLAYGATWLAGFSDGGNGWVSGVCDKTGTTFKALISTRVNSIVGTQRRRKPGVGS